MKKLFAYACVIVLGVAMATWAGDDKPPTPKPTTSLGFDALKKLVGEWTAPGPDGKPMQTQFRLTAGGSVLVETLFPGSAEEMVTVYHMDGSDLILTHYCMLGNQPRMKLNAAKSTVTELVFDFDGGTNFNPRHDTHMHSLSMTLPVASKTGPQKLHTSGTSFEGGKEKPGCAQTLTRRG